MERVQWRSQSNKDEKDETHDSHVRTKCLQWQVGTDSYPRKRPKFVLRPMAEKRVAVLRGDIDRKRLQLTKNHRYLHQDHRYYEVVDENVQKALLETNNVSTQATSLVYVPYPSVSIHVTQISTGTCLPAMKSKTRWLRQLRPMKLAAQR